MFVSANSLFWHDVFMQVVYRVHSPTLIASVETIWGGYRNSQSSSINHEYATLMSPFKGETAVCGSSNFCLLDDWEGDHWLDIGCRVFKWFLVWLVFAYLHI